MEREPVKLLLQGLDSDGGSASALAADLFRGAAQLLSAYAPRHGGLDINELVRTLQTCADVADAQRNDRQGAYKLPPVKLTV